MLFKKSYNTAEELTLQQVPEFVGLSMDEIHTRLENAFLREHLQWSKDFQAKLDDDRKTIHETLQKEKHFDLPNSEVFVEDVIKIDMGRNKKLYISRALIKRSLRKPLMLY